MTAVKYVSVLGLLIFLWSATVWVPAAEGQTVHALLIIMDDDPSVGPNVRVDRKRVQHILDSVQNELSWDVEKTDLLSSEDRATRAEILA